MPSAKKPLRSNRNRTLFPPAITLSFWQLRRTFWLLLLTGLGILAAVTIICAAPLYSQVAQTAGLEDALNRDPFQRSIIVNSQSHKANQGDLSVATSDLNSEIHTQLSRYTGFSYFSPETSTLRLLEPQAGTQALTPSYDTITLIGGDMEQAPQHLTMLQGRTPEADSADASSLEIALNSESAEALHAHIGSVYATQVATVHIPTSRNVYTINMHVVGIFAAPDLNDNYWIGQTFASQPHQIPEPGADFFFLVSNKTLVNKFSSFLPDTSSLQSLELPLFYNWYTTLDTSKISVADLDTLLTKLPLVKADVEQNTDFSIQDSVDHTSISVPISALTQYRDQLAVAQIPVWGFVLLILGLILYFVSLMAEFLVERQSQTLAILRSRGASRWQVFGALTVQSLGIGLLATLGGISLALLSVRLITIALVPLPDQSALELILGDTLQAIKQVIAYALTTLAVAMLAMVIAINRTTALDVLAMRREAARSIHKPLWQRLNLDVAAILLIVVGYIITEYTISSHIIDDHLRLILLSPLMLARSVFTILGAILLFLRFFPFLLQAGSWLTLRGRGAAPMVALAQMARAPRQAVRMTLLLSLATALTIFSIIFYASQEQRAADIASFQSGADFSGLLTADQAQFASLQDRYRHIPGVTSATLGLVRDDFRAGSATGGVTLMAVDTDTFAQTIAWPHDNSTQSLDTLMRQLSSMRTTVNTRQSVPAIIDASLWHVMNLKQGQLFTLSGDGIGNIEVVVVAQAMVQHLPAVYDTGSGGLLLDFQTLLAAEKQNALTLQGQDNGDHPADLQINHVWLRAKDDATSLQNIRAELSIGALHVDQLSDRRRLAENLHHAPLYLNLIGMLGLGASAALLLALLGNLIASWLNARGRQVHFAILRALGAAPGQIARTLTWEQAIVYTTSLVLGVLFGAFISAMVIPSLLFSNVPSTISSSEEFYLLQNIPPIQIIVPTLLGVALAILVGICIVALGMMVRVVSRPTLAHTLRINED